MQAKSPFRSSFLIQGLLQENVQMAKEKKGVYDDTNLYGESMHEFEGYAVLVGKNSTTVNTSSKGKRKG